MCRRTLLVDLKDRGANVVDRLVEFVEQVLMRARIDSSSERRESELQRETHAEEALDDGVVQVARESFALLG